MRKLALAIVLLTVLAAIAPAYAQSELELARERVTATSERVELAHQRADGATQRFHEAESLEANLARDIENLEDDVAVLQSQFDELQDDLSEFAIDQYIEGGVEEASHIAEPDTSKFVRADALREVLTGENADLLDRFRSAQADLDLARSDLEDRRDAQLEAIASLDRERITIFSELEIVRTELLGLEDILAGLEEEERLRLLEEARIREEAEAARRAEEARIAAEEAARLAAEEEAARAEQAAEDEANGVEPDNAEPVDNPTPPTPIASGEWVCPVQGAVSFTDTWGAPRSGGRTHKGVDMFAVEGTPAVAPVSGEVELRSNSIGGLSFHLFGDDGNYYYGTHLSAYGNSGRVEAGTIVGYVGETGNATTPHLHFEIHPGGRGNAVNPYGQTAQYCL